MIGVYQPIQPKDMLKKWWLIKMEAATTDTRMKLAHPVRRWLELTAVRIEPFWRIISRRARLNRLKAFAPRISPMVRSGASTMSMALMPVKSSGNEVINAIRIRPVQTPPSPVLSAIMSPYLAILFPEKKIMMIHNINLTQTKFYLRLVLQPLY